jgi:RNA polymerase sigma factor (sigma-70 family)
MANSGLNSIVRVCRRRLSPAGSGDHSDADLLRRFTAERDEAAFAVLVRRHGPLVFGVCQRILRNAADADDAFQSTFLVLVQKAGSIEQTEELGHWLYGVAYRTALRARSDAAKRRDRERRAGRVERTETASRPEAQEVWSALDQELTRLPERFRTPFVLCCLQGKTNEEAAALLGCPLGTVLSRLARSRHRLRAGLIRRGVTASAAALATSPSGKAEAGVPPIALIRCTTDAAMLVATGAVAPGGMLSARVVALTEGVLRAMSRHHFLTIASILAATVVATVVATGVGLTSYRAYTAEPPVAERPIKADAPPPAGQNDARLIRGTWTTVSSERDGIPATPAPANLRAKVEITADTYGIRANVAVVRVPFDAMTYRLDPTKQPKEMDFTTTDGTNKGRLIPAIYALQGDALTICFAKPGGVRPTKFTTAAGSGHVLVVLKRDRR